jgi:hypothetical protein
MGFWNRRKRAAQVGANDRGQAQKRCKPIKRSPPMATERLSRLDDGRLLYELRHRWRDGTTHVAFEPLELLERLAALVPYPRSNMVRYHGVLAPAARYRSQVVPSAHAENGEADADDPADGVAGSSGSASASTAVTPYGPFSRSARQSPRSSGCTEIEPEQPAEPLTAVDVAEGIRAEALAGLDQSIVQSLVVSLSMVMGGVLPGGSSK